MRRLVVALSFALLPALPVHAQTVDLSSLHLGRIQEIRPVELDGRPGSEWIVRRAADGPTPNTNEWTVIYPGRCITGPVTIHLTATFSGPATDSIADTDGDGIAEIVRFDPGAFVFTGNAPGQTVTWLRFPTCADSD